MNLYLLSAVLVVNSVALVVGLRRIEAKFAGAGTLRKVSLHMHSADELAGRGSLHVDAISTNELNRLLTMMGQHGWVGWEELEAGE